MDKLLFSGCGVALVTPFKRDLTLDVEGLTKLVNHVIDGGVDFIVALGTTGEAVSQSRTECIRVLQVIHTANGGRVPLIAGPFGGNNTTGIIQRFKDYQGILSLPDYVAVMSSVPGYVKPNQEGMYQHFMKVAEESPLPVLLYNVPSRTGAHLSAATTVRLAKASKKFIGVKEASGDSIEARRILRERPAGFQVFSGDDTTALPVIACGADGVISVVANAYPGLFSEMTRATLQGKLERARRLDAAFIDLHPLLYADGNPSGIKAVMRQLGLCEDYVRLPMVEVSAATREALVEEVLKLEVEKAPRWV